METSVFKTLSVINVNDKVEKKNNMTYLSWADAWGEVKKLFPDANYKVLREDNGLPYIYDPLTGYMVSTEVKIGDLTHTMWLPVMDGANKAMKAEPYTYKGVEWINNKKTPVDKTVDAATMFDINKTIMRCLTKNLAMFGLGLYIYSKEDSPEAEVVVEQPKADSVLAELVVGSANWNKVVAYITANKAIGYDAIIKQLNRKYTVSKATSTKIKSLLV